MAKVVDLAAAQDRYFMDEMALSVSAILREPRIRRLIIAGDPCAHRPDYHQVQEFFRLNRDDPTQCQNGAALQVCQGAGHGNKIFKLLAEWTL